MADIHKSNASKGGYQVTDLPQSAINLTNTAHTGGLVIGRMYPATYAYTFPHDKISDRHDFNLLAEQLATPIVSRLHASIHNFYVPFRAIDSGFKNLLNPTKQNNMSASLSVPSFKLSDIVAEIIKLFWQFLPIWDTTESPSLPQSMSEDDFDAAFIAIMQPYITEDIDFDSFWQNIDLSAIKSFAVDYYNDDIFDDLLAKLRAIGNPVGAKSFDWYYNMWTTIFDFFCGEGSVLDYLDYPIVSHESVRSWLLKVIPRVRSANWVSIEEQSNLKYPNPEAPDVIVIFTSSLTAPKFGFDAAPRSEYPLRALYAIWFEHFRNKDLEPRKSTLPEYTDFGPSSLFSTNKNFFLYCLLPLRPRCWADDPFTAAQIDDISRHVYAPIVYDPSISSDPRYQQNTLLDDANEAQTQQVYGQNLSSLSVSFTDYDGTKRYIALPVPASLNLSTNTQAFSVEGLDLFALKKTEMLQRYLKRKFYFGDEYRDEMRAQFDVTIADYALLRPTYISGMVKDVDISQQVANTGAPAGSDSSEMVEQGARLAYGSVDSKDASDGYEFFAEEFGIIISIFSIVPRAQYNHVSPLHSMLKSMDFPRPVFANQQEELIVTEEISRVGLTDLNNNYILKPFGFVPYGHGFRYKLDTVHGQMLSSKYDYTFARFFEGLTDDGTPKLNYWFIHCRPNIPMFANSILLDGQFYGSITSNLYVQRSLPMPVEVI